MARFSLGFPGFRKVSFVQLLTQCLWWFGLNSALIWNRGSIDCAICFLCFHLLSIVINGAWSSMECSFYDSIHMDGISKMSASMYWSLGWGYKSFSAFVFVASLSLSLTLRAFYLSPLISQTCLTVQSGPFLSLLFHLIKWIKDWL